MKRGKKYKNFLQSVDKKREYKLKEAIEVLQKNKLSKFDETLEIHIKTTIDAKKSDQQVRGSVILPHSAGKTKKIAVITSEKKEDAKDADMVKGEELIEDIKKGKINFDVLIATPEMMPKLATVARVLGPRGLMPNPKTGTVTTNVKEAITEFKKGKIDFKNDKTGNIHQAVGKLSMKAEQLLENCQSFLEAVEKAKQPAVKGKLISKISLCSTMSPSLKIKFYSAGK